MIRTAIAESFRARIEGAPPAPSPDALRLRARTTGRPAGHDGEEPPRARREGRTRRRTHALRLATALAAAAALVAALILFDRESEPLGPHAALVRAAERYLELRDAELAIRVEVPAIADLARMLGDEDPQDEAKHYRLYVRAPMQALLQEIDGPDGEWNPELDLTGFDDGLAWEYDADEGTIRLVPDDAIDEDALADLDEDLGLLQYLTFEVAREVADHRKYAVTDITGAPDRRVGRRVLRVETRWTEKEGFLARASASQVVVHLDAATGRIQRAIVDAKLLGASVIRIGVDLVATNSGLAPEWFRFRTHLPETPVVREETRTKNDDDD